MGSHGGQLGYSTPNPPQVHPLSLPPSHPFHSYYQPTHPYPSAQVDTRFYSGQAQLTPANILSAQTFAPNSNATAHPPPLHPPLHSQPPPNLYYTPTQPAPTPQGWQPAQSSPEPPSPFANAPNNTKQQLTHSNANAYPPSHPHSPPHASPGWMPKPTGNKGNSQSGTQHHETAQELMHTNARYAFAVEYPHSHPHPHPTPIPTISGPTQQDPTTPSINTQQEE
jgi:hypothetical protein